MEENIIKNIKTTMQVEGMILDKSDIDIINRFLKNEITEKEGIDEIKLEFKNIK